MRGHEEASGIKYVPKELIAEWEKKDPIANYEKFLLDSKILSLIDIENIKKEISKDIESNLTKTFNEERINSSLEMKFQMFLENLILKKLIHLKKFLKKDLLMQFLMELRSQ